MRLAIKCFIFIYSVAGLFYGLWLIDRHVWGTPRMILFYGFWLVVVPSIAALALFAFFKWVRSEET